MLDQAEGSERRCQLEAESARAAAFRLPGAMDVHREIIEALRQQDGTAARRGIAADIETATGDLASWLEAGIPETGEKLTIWLDDELSDSLKFI